MPSTGVVYYTDLFTPNAFSILIDESGEASLGRPKTLLVSESFIDQVKFIQN